MGMEVKEGCISKEPDGVIVDSNDMSPIVSSEPSPIHSDVLPNKSDVRECTLENTLKISEACQAGKGEEQRCRRIKVANSYLKERTKPVNMKLEVETREKASPKSTSKTCTTNERINCTVPQPFSLATEKRALSRPVETETVVHQSPRKSKTTAPSNSGKKYQQNMMKKLVKSETKKHSDEEELSSAASDISSPVMACRTKTVASAPVFKSMERAEKRKEFNSKLEEKQQALEAEKLQHEVRTKEEIEAAIKQLRRSMMFKASPLPSFYHEDPSRKHEGKKALQTSIKTLEFGRRKSCSNAGGLSEKRASKANRYSLGIQKENPNSSSDTNSGSTPSTLAGRTYGGNEKVERGREFMNRENNLEISVMS